MWGCVNPLSFFSLRFAMFIYTLIYIFDYIFLTPLSPYSLTPLLPCCFSPLLLPSLLCLFLYCCTPSGARRIYAERSERSERASTKRASEYVSPLGGLGGVVITTYKWYLIFDMIAHKSS